MTDPAPPSIVSRVSRASQASSIQSFAALNIIRKHMRQDYVHECTTEDALRVLEVMPAGKDCLVRRCLENNRKKITYKVKVRGHAEDDIYDEKTMFSLIQNGGAHFVTCKDTVDTFFRIRTPPQLQHVRPLKSLFVHASMPDAQAVKLLKERYDDNASHTDRKNMMHVLIMEDPKNDQNVHTMYIDPLYTAPSGGGGRSQGAVLSKRSSLVRACCRFMPSVVVPACSSSSSMVSESHVVSIEPADTPHPESKLPGDRAQNSPDEANKSDIESKSDTKPDEANKSDIESKSNANAETETRINSDKDACTDVDTEGDCDTKSEHSDLSSPPPLPSSCVGSSPTPASTVLSGGEMSHSSSASRWPPPVHASSVVPPPPPPPPPPPQELQSAPGTVYTS